MGGLKHHRIEGGHGGRRGHSNMDHWGTTAEIKDATRGLRRREAKVVIAQEQAALNEEPARGATKRARPGRPKSAR